SKQVVAAGTVVEVGLTKPLRDPKSEGLNPKECLKPKPEPRLVTQTLQIVQIQKRKSAILYLRYPSGFGFRLLVFAKRAVAPSAAYSNSTALLRQWRCGPRFRCAGSTDSVSQRWRVPPTTWFVDGSARAAGWTREGGN